MRTNLRIAALLLSASALIGCMADTRCTVTNHSAATLTHLVLFGSRFSVQVPDIAPGQSRTVILSPRGEEPTFAVSFQANGREYRHTTPTYFGASGYTVDVGIDPAFLVTVTIGVAGSSGAPSPTPQRGAS